MTIAAPRLDDRLLDELFRAARTSQSAAEIRRLLVRRARELGLAPPSYEHVRRLVAAERHEYELERERTSEILPLVLDVALGFEHGTELLRVAHGERRRRH